MESPSFNPEKYKNFEFTIIPPDDQLLVERRKIKHWGE